MNEMKRTYRGISLAVAAALALTNAEAETGRMSAADGDVKLLGPVGDVFGTMFENHVLAKDPVYLTDFYRTRTETHFWQTEFWGKYMHSAAPFWTMTGCPRLKAKLDAGVENLLAQQSADGYLGNYSEEARFAPGTWDVWGVKYTMMGLLHYVQSEELRVKSEELGGRGARALEACKRLCDYLISKVGPGTVPGIGGTGNYAGQPSCSVLEPVVWLYRRTREKRYLAFADFIVKEMTEREDGPRLLDLALRHVPVADRSSIPAEGLWSGVRTNRGKAYEMMSCYQGLLDYVEVKSEELKIKSLADDPLFKAALASAEDIVAEEINLAGSGASSEHWYHGRRHQHEAFGHTQETCVTITWMRLCEKLLSLTGDARWADRLERTFYNAYLAALRPDGRVFAAYTPLDGSRSEGHLHCRTHTNCCNENGPRGFLSFMRSVLQAKGDTVYLNQYVSASAAITVPSLNEKVRFDIQSLYPVEGEVTVDLRIPEAKRFRLALRMPACTSGNRILVSGKEVEAKPDGKGYVTIDRTWQPGDEVAVIFGLPVKAHRLGSSIAFTRGPVLLARDSRFGDGDLGEVVRATTLEKQGLSELFRLERADDPRQMRLVVSAALPLGFHDVNPNGRQMRTVRFCDYASAGNAWTADDVCRVWFPVVRRADEVLKSEKRGE